MFFRLQPNMKCIVFVNRIVIARALSYLIRTIKILSSWKSDFLVGVHSGLRSMSRKTMHSILGKFRSGEVWLICCKVLVVLPFLFLCHWSFEVIVFLLSFYCQFVVILYLFWSVLSQLIDLCVIMFFISSSYAMYKLIMKRSCIPFAYNPKF